MIVAIIGGIGSGKSSVLDILEERGFRICDCDKIYKQVCQRRDYIEQIAKTFDVVRDGKIDKTLLGKAVFADSAKLQLLNSIAHPYIFDKIQEIYLQDKSPLFVEVSAFDKSMKEKFDFVVLVKSGREKRVQRVKLRSGYDEDYILSVMSNQMSEEQMQAAADYVIENDGGFASLQEQAERLVGALNVK